MTPSQKNYFLDTIYLLRNEEEMLVHTRLMPVTDSERDLIADFLETEYNNECLEYPGQAPAFDREAALWGATTLYTAAQLYLDRQADARALPSLLPAYTGSITPGAVLSADLCLRFTPALLKQLQLLMAGDEMIPLLDAHLQTWHYSGIGSVAPATGEVLEEVLQHACVRQLYVNRIISRKAKRCALQPQLLPLVKAAVGNYGNYFWNDL